MIPASLKSFMDNGRSSILMISDHSDPLATLGGEEAGGQNVYVDELSSRLAEKGHTVHVLTRQNRPDLPRVQESDYGYTVYRVPVGPEGFLPKEEFIHHISDFIQEAQLLADQHSYDVIHSHYWLSGVAATALQKSHNIPVVQTFHSLGKVKHRELKGIDLQHQHVREDAEQDIIDYVDTILAESEEERRVLRRLYGADSEKITVVPAGVDTQWFSPKDQNEARKTLGITQRNVIVYVGRFVAQKGLPTLLQAYAQARGSLTDEEKKETVLLLIGGDLEQGTEKESVIQKRIRTALESLHLHDSVRIVGQVQNADLPVYYQAADFSVVPSRYEPFGIVPLEAMACGIPVIASFVGGMKSTVRNLYTGFHMRSGNSADLAYKMLLLLKNPALREQMGKQARQRAEQEFSWETVTDRVLSCYHATIHERELVSV